MVIILCIVHTCQITTMDTLKNTLFSVIISMRGKRELQGKKELEYTFLVSKLYCHSEVGALSSSSICILCVILLATLYSWFLIPAMKLWLPPLILNLFSNSLYKTVAFLVALATSFKKRKIHFRLMFIKSEHSWRCVWSMPVFFHASLDLSFYHKTNYW